MFCYENINHLFGYHTHSVTTDMWIPFFTGGFSKCAASVVLLPINVVRMRLQMKNYTLEQIRKLGIEAQTNFKEQVHYKGVIDAFSKIYKHEGISAFYKGLTPLVMKVFPSSGVFFMVYEMTLRLLHA